MPVIAHKYCLVASAAAFACLIADYVEAVYGLEGRI